MRGAKLSVPTGIRPRPWAEALLKVAAPAHPITAGIDKPRINEYGAGRSFTITIGHDIDTFRRIEFIRMFPRGVEWAATGEVALEGPDRSGERRFLPRPYYNRGR
ncbi:ThuA domain-containing protein [Microbacterium sp. zg.B48]|uniref:ThuA domain-containing protein n=1 Tax=Microbacterium sp. zg.B48 TaxID=2969408 RepID=UPI00214BB856|nr:ThuA domain-containing protein [Microbacterium sp. zg.B48]MCR2762958.1 ThuA domain-containing protein [Microbacterium sp. zg.B48]